MIRLVLLMPLVLATATPTDVYHAALKSAAGQRSVHYVAASKLGGNTEVMVGDAAVVTVIVAANTAYVRGDRFTLQAYLGLTAGQASRFAGRWFFLKPPSGAYAVVAEAVRLQSFVAELRMPAPYTTAPATTIGGKHVTGVKSHEVVRGQRATIVLYVAAGSPLPVAQIGSGAAGKITTTLGPWNTPVAVSAPKGAVAFS